ncbi:heat shock 70 kDa protein 12B-like [Mercenaria mercenaria]|uniref:heat shock 70 kDa protein 12B-like n=1 Tax=Mercenaria mercenaria TaxID=6596 RepID=UPI00234F823F|nr:heat shock 70 kDa protein 12B-like [Mercenaria mercenaria]
MSEDVLLVGAVDFGTTYSGWAFSYSTDFEKDPTNSFVKHWQCGQHISEKAPTCVLVNPDGTTVAAFGYEAENKYVELVTKGKHEEYYFFKRFKMALNKKLGDKLDRDLMLDDIRQRQLPALDVFAMSIKYLLDDMLAVVNQRAPGRSVTLDNILLILTVPALWTDAAKNFMREAAIKAGCVSKKVILALEPEVASIYSQFLHGDQTIDGRFIQFPVGIRYLCLDAGGGTVDLAIHEVEEDFQVKEVSDALGGDWGGTMVDDAFELFITEIFGEEIYNTFKEEHPGDFIELMRNFENKKAIDHPGKVFQVDIKLPSSVINLLNEKLHTTLIQQIKTSKFSKSVTVVKNKLMLTSELFESFYEEPIKQSIALIERTLKDKNVGKLKAILMVGGFSQSKIFQNAVMSAFPKLRVVVPKESSASIVKGAVAYGHHPMSITERILKYTYGVEVMKKFKPGVHPQSKMVETDSGKYCRNLFSKHVEKGQIVQVGEAQIDQRYTPSDSQKTSAQFKLFASSAKNPKYTDDMCTCIGQVNIDLDDHDGDLTRGLWVSFTFSGPEIIVDVFDEKTGKIRQAKTDFLGASLI